MDNPNLNESASDRSTRARKTNLEESSIFASRPRATAKFAEREIAATSAWRKWLPLGALILVLILAFIFGSESLGLQGGDQLAGFAGGASNANTETGTPTLTDVPTATLTLTPSLTPTPTLGVGDSRIRPSDGMLMMYIPQGPFTMGIAVEEAMAECLKFREECDPSWYADQSPSHVVTLNAFWMDQTEVTNAMYALCVNVGICTPPRQNGSNRVEDYYGNPEYADYPVVYITWKQANNYCQWAGARLPTEAEWEKAARGTDERLYPWGNSAPECSLLNFNPFIENTCKDDTSAVRNHPGGQSPYQIFNMAGNVAEWVMDWYDPNYYSSSPSIDPQGAAQGFTKILRGGSWFYDEEFVRVTYRYNQDPRYYYSFTGFRCAVSE